MLAFFSDASEHVVGSSMGRATFWTQRPSSAQAIFFAALATVLGVALAIGTDRASPVVVRSNLQHEQSGLEPLYLTPLREDPARVLLTSRRENSTWARDQASQAGDPYWIRRYSDPARPGLAARILLTSRSRGAHLLVPLGALDLERALAEPVDLPPTTGAAKPGEERSVRAELKRVYLSRAFAGVFLHLRFPERRVAERGPDAGKALDFDLVVVRENELRTTDFLLQPNAELYRSLLADGRMPAGALRSNPNARECVFLVPQESPTQAVPLYSPVSLFDELALCWGPQLATLLDDRWRPGFAPALELRPPSHEVRARVKRSGELQILARVDPEEERRALAAALARFSSGS